MNENNWGTPVLEADGLGRRYRRGWALRDCSFALPAGRVCGLVGPNGAGKSTLMRLTTGLVTATEEELRLFGARAGRDGTHRRLGFLAQDKPLYRTFTVAEMLRAAEKLNPGWDSAYARRLVEEAEVPLKARVGTLSGGQRTRVAVACVLGRRPELLLLDEPLADLDPLARREVMQTILSEVAETGMTVLLSSHVIADLEGVCDHLVLLSGGRVLLAGGVDELLAAHRVLIGSREQEPPPEESIVERRVSGRQVTLLARSGGGNSAGWEADEPGLEELTLGYLRAEKANGALEVVA